MGEAENNIMTGLMNAFKDAKRIYQVLIVWGVLGLFGSLAASALRAIFEFNLALIWFAWFLLPMFIGNLITHRPKTGRL